VAGARRVDGEPRNEAGEGRGAVGLVGHADRDADGEEKRHVVEDRTARCEEERRGDVLAGGGGDPVADAHEDGGDGKHGDRQHDRPAESLEEFHGSLRCARGDGVLSVLVKNVSELFLGNCTRSGNA